MKTITFYSYKGGVGRSLALSNIAIRLSELNKKVCVLDFDLEAPGLQFKFGNYTAAKPIEKGIVDYIDTFTSTHEVPKSIRDFSIDLNPANRFFEKIQLIPAGNIDNPSYWRKLSCINWSSMFYEENSKGVQFFLDLKHKIETELQPDILLIDSRTGITDIAGITLKLLADEVVILAANNKENLYGSKKIIKSLVSPENNLLGKPPKITFILTRLPYTDNPNDKVKELNTIERKTIEFKTELSLQDFKIFIIHSDRRLEENERPLIGDDYEAKDVSIANDYLKLFDELTSDVLTQEEIVVFKRKKLAEKEFERGVSEKDYYKKIIHFTEAIKLDNTQLRYYFFRGNAFLYQADFGKAEQDFAESLKLEPTSVEVLKSLTTLYLGESRFSEASNSLDIILQLRPQDEWSLYNKAWLFQTSKKHEEAIGILSTIINTINPNSANAYNARADIMRQLNNYENAYKDAFKAIDLDPSEPSYFATLAEIYACENKPNEFYLNLNIALARGSNANTLRHAKNVYEKFKNEPRFITLLAKYSIDINDIFNDD